MTRALEPSDTSYVYVIGSQRGPQKVGFSQFPKVRAAALKQPGSARPHVHHQQRVLSTVVREVEALAHWLLRDHALGRERFNVSPREASLAVAEAARRHAGGERAPRRAEINPTTPLVLKLSARTTSALEEWRARQRPVLSKAAAARKLIELALEVEERDAAEHKPS